MDRETLSNYGWVVIVVIVLAIMIALASPFGSYIKNGIVGVLDDFSNEVEVVPSVEYLQDVHDFKYYSTVQGAISDINAGTAGENGNENKDLAEAGVYIDKAGIPNVVLLKDVELTAKLAPSVDMVINLGGNVLSGSGILIVDSMGGELTIDGRLEGSKIINDYTTFQLRAGTVNINGVTCINEGSADPSKEIRIVDSMATTNISNCNFVVTAPGAAIGINIRQNSSLNISDSYIESNAGSGVGRGINIGSSATATISNTKVFGTSESSHSVGLYVGSSANVTALNSKLHGYCNYDGSASLSYGVQQTGNLSLINCDVKGTHSGLQLNRDSSGSLYINGGSFESYGHGGLYLVGDGTNEIYIENATFKECSMPDGYTVTGDGGTNGTGLYIGNKSNLSVYMNNCNIYGSVQPIVLRDEGGVEGVSLYISNSKINKDSSRGIRVDNNTYRIYMGVGNNFDSNDLWIHFIAEEDLSTVVVATDGVYKK